MKLLNGTTLAKRLGVPRGFVTAMRHFAADPFAFAFGGRTTEQAALDWLEKHPQFRWTDYVESHRKTPRSR